jgi:hypothetical protein
VNPTSSLARASRPGVPISSALVALLLIAGLAAACSPREPAPPQGRRAWQGPGDSVASVGTTQYERREIAQKVTLPACVQVGPASYQFARVTLLADASTTPPGLMDTMYYLDRWRLWTRPGVLEGQPVVFVTVRGSTGVLGEYELAQRPCGA